jgi:hypothetical protein
VYLFGLRIPVVTSSLTPLQYSVSGLLLVLFINLIHKMKFGSWYHNGNEIIIFIYSLFSANWEWAFIIFHFAISTSFYMLTSMLEPDDFLDIDHYASTLAAHIKQEAKGG